MAKNILLLLFASICISAAAQKSPFKLVTTQLSKGYSPGNDYIQLLVDGVNTCSEKLGGDSIANLSHIAIYDSNLDSIFMQKYNIIYLILCIHKKIIIICIIYIIYITCTQALFL